MFPRLPLGCPELLHPGRVERILDIGMPVALPDDLLVDQQVVALAEDVGQQPAVPVPAVTKPVKLELSEPESLRA